MTDNDSLLLEQFQQKMRKLMDLYEDLKTKKCQLEQQLAGKEQEIVQLKEQLDNLNRSYSNLKQSKVLEVSGHDLDSTRHRIERLVCEIDHCINLINTK